MFSKTLVFSLGVLTQNNDQFYRHVSPQTFRHVRKMLIFKHNSEKSRHSKPKLIKSFSSSFSTLHAKPGDIFLWRDVRRIMNTRRHLRRPILHLHNLKNFNRDVVGGSSRERCSGSCTVYVGDIFLSAFSKSSPATRPQMRQEVSTRGNARRGSIVRRLVW